MKKQILFYLLLPVFLLPARLQAQGIALDWVQTEAYPQENANGVFDIDASNGDVVSGILNVWIDVNNNIHANALNRRNPQGQMVTDTLFNNNSYLDYRIRGFYPKNGENYFCLGYQNSSLVFEKTGTTGQLLWQHSIPRANLFFSYDNRLRGNNYVIDDAANNRMLWMFEQWDAAWTTKSVGILATDNTTGTISIVDTLSYPNSTNASFAIEIQQDPNGHIYFSSMDDAGRVIVSLLDNGQLQQEAVIDSAGFRDYGLAMRAAGNTLFVTSQVDVNTNARVGHLHIYSIDNAGHLTLQSAENMANSQIYLTGMKSDGNTCYVYSSAEQNFSNASLVPFIRKYNGSGTLLSTTTLPSYTGKTVYDLSFTGLGIYCSMYGPGFATLEVIDPATMQHLDSYNMLTEFSSSSNDGVQQLEARSVNFNMDIIYAAGNKWITQNLFARLAKYTYTGSSPKGIDETANDNSLLVFPNPVSGTNTIQFVNSKSASFAVELRDVNGRILLRENATGGRFTADVSGFAPGVYFGWIITAEMVKVVRFVKE